MKKSNYPPVEKSKLGILKQKERLLSVAIKHFGDGTDVFMGHFVFAAIVDRTLSNIHGFLLLSEERNFLCASSVLRQQIDTAMRTNAFSLVSDKEALAEKVFSGVNFSNLKDDNGQMMKDYYLRQKLAIRYPWIDAVYKETSGAVHLSQKHIFGAISSVKEEGMMEFSLNGLTDRPIEDFAEIFAAFEHSLRMTFEVLFPNLECDKPK